jgi:hypothetical protein
LKETVSEVFGGIYEVIGRNFRQEIYWQIDSASKYALSGGI